MLDNLKYIFFFESKNFLKEKRFFFLCKELLSLQNHMFKDFFKFLMDFSTRNLRNSHERTIFLCWQGKRGEWRVWWFFFCLSKCRLADQCLIERSLIFNNNASYKYNVRSKYFFFWLFLKNPSKIFPRLTLLLLVLSAIFTDEDFELDSSVELRNWFVPVLELFFNS